MGDPESEAVSVVVLVVVAKGARGVDEGKAFGVPAVAVMGDKEDVCIEEPLGLEWLREREARESATVVVEGPLVTGPGGSGTAGFSVGESEAAKPQVQQDGFFEVPGPGGVVGRAFQT